MNSLNPYTKKRKKEIYIYISIKNIYVSKEKETKCYYARDMILCFKVEICTSYDEIVSSSETL